MDMPGIVKVREKNISLDVEPFFKGQEIESAFRCLLNHEVRVTGNFEFYGKILTCAGLKISSLLCRRFRVLT
jgi:hypothetical protein